MLCFTQLLFAKVDFADYGRKLLSDDTEDQVSNIRRKILLETLQGLGTQRERVNKLQRAQHNLQIWKEQSRGAVEAGIKNSLKDKVFVYEADWGTATQKLTQKYGVIFAVLNMANA